MKKDESNTRRRMKRSPTLQCGTRTRKLEFCFNLEPQGGGCWCVALAGGAGDRAGARPGTPAG